MTSNQGQETRKRELGMPTHTGLASKGMPRGCTKEYGMISDKDVHPRTIKPNMDGGLETGHPSHCLAELKCERLLVA